ncbi:TIGR03757 family integrating conjugative element protein [Pseudomonas syringae pv. actinidiae]|uniref:TIGR03757 family integrating conjugative element protein n=1 Tax=Pseudomonas syringae TaxID=317 RepID=UPI00036D8A56|nr:TIGR03757 family integrating conjugative element protein [Pseudomonas syringae]MBL3624190.1 TIGR03757 family integrating conjugative element protein [Pseudomonas syringae pv. actinidiae]MBL3661129.1 TIGR03757 family integrating conjugative element protein [Pseudomonas syringae pv. actinidiae]MDU8211345.1 TIGR03757 family integrating conjugative element protein [Pseudomonas syringae pv. actinidiae]MDU8243224.1 TIGR03757 family integrating conjugative element protein [Pseudomonas syringae pv. 
MPNLPSPGFRKFDRLAPAFLIAALIQPLAHAETWVITDRNHPVQVPSGARLILLDDSERLEAKLSEGLPADPQRAAAIMQQRLRSSDAQRLQQDLVAAQQNLVDAWTLGVTKIPAVVVDRRYVVYGETDVGSATRSIARWKGGMR